MKQISIFLFILLLGASQALFAQQNAVTVQGTLIDASTKQPLVGASIRLENSLKGTFSDNFGNYRLEDLPQGSITLVFSFVGYDTQRETLELAAGERKMLNISLNSGALLLDDITVRAGDRLGINAVNAIDIALRPINNSQDVLRVVPGLFIAQHAGGGKAEQIFLRGFDIDHGTDINLTVDGMPVNMVSHAHGQGYADLHFVIPELIGQVNFDKGPYRADKGNFTTSGFVEMNTRTHLDQNMLKLQGGQFGTYRLMSAFNLLGENAQSKGQSAYIAGEYLYSDGFFDSSQNFSRLNLFGRYRHYIDENQLFDISFSTFRSNWDASGQIPVRAVESGQISNFGAIDDTEGGNTSRTNLNLQYYKSIGEKSLLKQQLFLIDYDFELYSNFTFFLEDPINGDQIRQKENRKIFGYLGSYQTESSLGNMPLTSEIGIGIRYDEIRGNELAQSTARRFTRGFLALGDVNEINVSAYLNENLTLAPKWQLNAGLRLDYFDFGYIDLLSPIYENQQESQAVLSPKLSLTFDASPQLRLFAKSGMGFHSNDTRVVVAQAARETLPQAYGLDLGFVWKPVKNLVVQSALWQLDLEQEFVYVGDAAIVEPSGRTRRRGIDLSLRYQILPWLFFDGDLNLTEPRARDEAEGENLIPLAPTFTSIGGLSVQLKSGFSGSLRYRYLSGRPANEDNSTVAEGYMLLDAVLEYRQPKYALGLSVENILNQDWREAQFDTESRLFNEPDPVSEIHFTPGTPFFARLSFTYFFR